MKNIFIFLFAVIFSSSAYATHQRGIDITIVQDSTNSLKFFATVTITVKVLSISAQDSLVIKWGDGNADTIPLFDTLGVSTNETEFRYKGNHVYQNVPPDSIVYVSVQDLNRIADLVNVSNSVNEPWYVETALNLKQLQYTTGNSTARFLSNMVLNPIANQIFIFDLQPNDTDGDSFYVELTTPLVSHYQTVGIYTNPNEIGGTVGSQIFSVNSSTGELIWDKPQTCATYVADFKISEYRNGKFLSSTLRDNNMIVQCVGSSNDLGKFYTTSISPNPTDGNFTITSSATIQQIEIINLLGEKIYSLRCNTSTQTMHLSSLSKGVYFISIKTAVGLAMKKVVVE